MSDTPEDGCKAEVLSAEQREIRRLKHELNGLTNAGVVECMVRNRAVFECIEQLEAENAALREKVSILENLCGIQADAAIDAARSKT